MEEAALELSKEFAAEGELLVVVFDVAVLVAGEDKYGVDAALEPPA